jgi:hypothetical protein
LQQSQRSGQGVQVTRHHRRHGPGMGRRTKALQDHGKQGQPGPRPAQAAQYLKSAFHDLEYIYFTAQNP